MAQNLVQEVSSSPARLDRLRSHLQHLMDTYLPDGFSTKRNLALVTRNPQAIQEFAGHLDVALGVYKDLIALIQTYDRLDAQNEDLKQELRISQLTKDAYLARMTDFQEKLEDTESKLREARQEQDGAAAQGDAMNMKQLQDELKELEERFNEQTVEDRQRILADIQRSLNRKESENNRLVKKLKTLEQQRLSWQEAVESAEHHRDEMWKRMMEAKKELNQGEQELEKLRKELRNAEKLIEENIPEKVTETLADVLCETSYKKLQAILSDNEQHYQQVAHNFATIVMKQGPDDPGSVLALGAGHCIPRFVPTALASGQQLKDTHAIVLARRGFITFLLEELLSSLRNEHSNIFMYDKTSAMFRVRDHLSFHVYLSTTPCGSATINIKEEDLSMSITPVERRQILLPKHRPGELGTCDCRIRLKVTCNNIENMEPEDVLRLNTFALDPTEAHPPPAYGHVIRIMSCSDKILKWNAIGWQGALLANFIHPIYMSTVSFGSRFESDKLRHSLCCRLPERFTEDLRNAGICRFHVQHPTFDRTTSIPPWVHPNGYPHHCIKWCLPDKQAEILYDGRNCHDGSCSSSCKRAHFILFRDICKLTKKIHCADTYVGCKFMAQKYMQAKAIFYKSMKMEGHGEWYGRGFEDDHFSL